MKFVIRLFFLFLSLSPQRVQACQCPISILSREECGHYEIIFRGKVLEVKSCGDKPGVATLEVLELYKGNSEKKFKLLFNCTDPCFYQFQSGEEWIIYSRYKQVNTGLMDYCSRSRRYFRNNKEDYYISTQGNTYEEELAFLRKELGLHRLLESKEQVNYGRNEIPNTTQVLIYMLSSILALVLFYFLFRRFGK